MMKIHNKTLKKAYRLLKSSQYGKVIAFLEPKVPIFLENYYFYYILGVACLENGDNGGADTYLKRAIQVNHEFIEPRLFLASLALRRKDTTEAVRLWLGILDLDPSCKEAKRGLDKIRQFSDSQGMNRYLQKNSFSPMLPKIGRRIPPCIFLVLFLGVLAGGLYLERDSFIAWTQEGKPPSRENISYLIAKYPCQAQDDQSAEKD
jgi:tetratricopeptide (TPR) repeat protein